MRKSELENDINYKPLLPGLDETGPSDQEPIKLERRALKRDTNNPWFKNAMANYKKIKLNLKSSP